MEYVIAWAGFLGAWALVAGPLRQAALELRDVQIDRDGFERARSAVEHKPISPWWWLLPPVAYVKTIRRGQRERAEMMDRLTADQRRQIYGFTNTANAWGLVAIGASLIAVKETWELVEQMEWSVWLFWAGLALMAIICVATTVSRIFRTERDVDPEGYAARLAEGRGRRGASTAPPAD